MKISGNMLIGASSVTGSKDPIQAINPATGEKLEPVYKGGSAEDVERACSLANAAFNTYRETSLTQRAQFLETIAENIEALGDELVERASAETGLPAARIVNERGRTISQLRLFADVVREGGWLGVRVDEAIPERQPPRPDLRMRHVPLGPVAVFGASNFPLAFSVAGGDTASALAAGAPVIVKGHSAHPGTSELVGRAIQSAVEKCKLPEGVFSLLFGSGRDIGTALVSDRRIKAVGFTGSRSGGTALMKVANNRPEPIPVYAEMSSINPMFLLPQAMRVRGAAIAEGMVNSMMMGAGQFCTSPGLIIALDDEATAEFIDNAVKHLQCQGCQTMLTPGIHASYEQGVGKLSAHPRVELLAQGQEPEGVYQCRPALFSTSAADFLADPELSEEVFGSGSLVVKCSDTKEFKQVAEALEGQLTATVHADKTENALFTRELLSILELRAGRILFDGFPTGVEVCHAMVHGGPFPATSDSRTTSVGSAAIFRFLRPVCYQNVPEDYLPKPLAENNPYDVPRLVNGKLKNT